MARQHTTAAGDATATESCGRPELDAAPAGLHAERASTSHERYGPLLPVAISDLYPVSDLRAALALGFDLATIGLAVVISERHFFPALYVLAVIAIGARQQGLLVLMHEASHERLLRNLRWNDRLGEFVLTWPLFFSMLAYRANHIVHHDYLNSAQDPDFRRYKAADSPEYRDWVYPRSRAAVLRPLLLDLLGLTFTQQLRRALRLLLPRVHAPAPAAGERPAPPKMPTSWRVARVLVYLSLPIGLTWLGGWRIFLLYWIVPIFTMLKMCIRLRQLAGHFAVYGGDGLRTTLCRPLERFLLAPHNIGYHVEHHLHPEVAWHALPELHQRMVTHGMYDAATPFRLSLGHGQVLADWTRTEAMQRATAVARS